MANTNAPFGFRPVRKLGGGEITTNIYSISTTYATPIYDGDPVEMTGTGRNVQLAAADNSDNIGVFKGCTYKTVTGEIVYSHYWPGVSDSKSEIKAYVIDDPDVIFEIQANACAESEIGVLADWNAGTGSALTGLSGAYATVTGVTATTDEPLRVMRLVDRPDNAYGTYAKIEVMFAEHALARVVAAVGGIN